MSNSITMLQNTEITLETYDLDGEWLESGFRIDITFDAGEKLFEAWLYHKDCGVKYSMFEMPSQDNMNVTPESRVTHDAFFQYVCQEIDEHISMYRESYMDE